MALDKADKRIIRIIIGLFTLGVALVLVRAILFPKYATLGSQTGEVSNTTGIVQILHGGCAPHLDFEPYIRKYLNDKHHSEFDPAVQMILNTKYGGGLINDMFTPKNGGEYIKYLDLLCKNKSKCKPVSFEEFSKWKWIDKAPQNYKQRWYANYHKALCGS